MKHVQNNKKTIGSAGENLVKRFLVKHGLEIVEQNYWKPWGEIDIVAKSENTIHFIEVKSKEIREEGQKYGGFRPKTGTPVQPTDRNDRFRPEDHMHSWKIKRFKRIIETWIMDRNYGGEWQIDVAIAYVSPETSIESVDMFWDIVL